MGKRAQALMQDHPLVAGFLLACGRAGLPEAMIREKIAAARTLDPILDAAFEKAGVGGINAPGWEGAWQGNKTIAPPKPDPAITARRAQVAGGVQSLKDAGKPANFVGAGTQYLPWGDQPPPMTKVPTAAAWQHLESQTQGAMKGYAERLKNRSLKEKIETHPLNPMNPLNHGYGPSRAIYAAQQAANFAGYIPTGESRPGLKGWEDSALSSGDRDLLFEMRAGGPQSTSFSASRVIPSQASLDQLPYRKTRGQIDAPPELRKDYLLPEVFTEPPPAGYLGGRGVMHTLGQNLQTPLSPLGFQEGNRWGDLPERVADASEAIKEYNANITAGVNPSEYTIARVRLGLASLSEAQKAWADKMEGQGYGYGARHVNESGIPMIEQAPPADYAALPAHIRRRFDTHLAPQTERDKQQGMSTEEVAARLKGRQGEMHKAYLDESPGILTDKDLRASRIVQMNEQIPEDKMPGYEEYMAKQQAKHLDDIGRERIGNRSSSPSEREMAVYREEAFDRAMADVQQKYLEDTTPGLPEYLAQRTEHHMGPLVRPYMYTGNNPRSVEDMTAEARGKAMAEANAQLADPKFKAMLATMAKPATPTATPTAAPGQQPPEGAEPPEVVADPSALAGATAGTGALPGAGVTTGMGAGAGSTAANAAYEHIANMQADPDAAAQRGAQAISDQTKQPPETAWETFRRMPGWAQIGVAGGVAVSAVMAAQAMFGDDEDNGMKWVLAALGAGGAALAGAQGLKNLAPRAPAPAPDTIAPQPAAPAAQP